MRDSILFQEGNYYKSENIKEFDVTKLKNVVGLKVSTIGAMGRGGFVYVITSNGEEFLFDYFSSKKKRNVVCFKPSLVWKILIKHLPINNDLKIVDNKWIKISDNMGHFFYINKDYASDFYKECKKLTKERKYYNDMRKRGVSVWRIIDEFIVPNEATDILFDLIKNQNTQLL